MRVPQGTTLALWLCVMALACLLTGCPDTAANVDAAGDVANDLGDVASDLGDVGVDAAKDVPTLTDLSDDRRDASDVGDVRIASDSPVPVCIPGMSIGCACVDGRTGAQTCQGDGTYGVCVCVTPDAATGDASAPDVVLPPLGARLIAPQSVSRVTSRRPTMRWVLPDGVTRARVQVCADRPCTRMLVQQEVTGTSWRPTELLSPGVTYWRVRGLDGDGGVAWSSATWEFVVGQRDAPVDTSFGTIRDVNGDGYDDFVVSEGYSPSYLDLFHGRSTMGGASPTQQIATLVSPVRARTFGDFNGDGFADIAATPLSIGIVDVRYGGRAGLPTSPSISLNGAQRRGVGVNITAGDVNGDGFSDLVTTARLAPGPSPFSYQMEVYLGGLSGISSAPSTVLIAPVMADDDVALVFLDVGDFNSDGSSDVVLRLHVRTVPSSQGPVWVLAGHPSEPLRSWIPLNAPLTTSGFGYSARGVGDLDGDGNPDLVVSAMGDQVYLYYGQMGSFTTSPTAVLHSPEAPCFAPYGFSDIGSAGDYDGDGRADLVIGDSCVPYTGATGEFRLGVGTAFIYPGRADRMLATPTVFRGTYAEGFFGAGVGGMGDFNADGFGDLIVQKGGTGFGPDGGAEGMPTIYLFLGSATGVSRTASWIFHGSGGGFWSPFALLVRDSSERGA